jgi:dGTPase
MARAEGVVTDLFARYFADVSAMPEAWRPLMTSGDTERARGVADFVAGMTDGYALNEYRRLFGRDPAIG